MSARREPPPPIPIRQDLQHQHASRDRLAHERDAAERHAWDALGRYKFVIGYWCGIRVHLNRLCATPKPNPGETSWLPPGGNGEDVMTTPRPTAADHERRARAAARRRRRDETVAGGALRRAKGSTAVATAALRAEAGAYRAEADRLASKGVDGGLGAWRAAERRDRAADLLDPGGGA